MAHPVVTCQAVDMDIRVKAEPEDDVPAPEVQSTSSPADVEPSPDLETAVEM